MAPGQVLSPVVLEQTVEAIGEAAVLKVARWELLSNGARPTGLNTAERLTPQGQVRGAAATPTSLPAEPPPGWPACNQGPGLGSRSSLRSAWVQESATFWRCSAQMPGSKRGHS
jgi:hypothetical protein